MIELSASEIAAATGGRLTDTANPDTTVTAATPDSREVATLVTDQGSATLFLAKPGEFSDGHNFIPAALDAGASLILAEKETTDEKTGQPHPAIIVENTVRAMGALAHEIVNRIRAHSPTTVIGITGSVGKTTTKDTLATILRTLEPADGAVVSPQGSYNGEVGVPLTVFTASLDAKYLVIEMGADHVGNITELCDIVHPDIAVVLTVGSAHAESFGSVENIAKTKGELVEALKPGGIAILNADDTKVSAMASRAGEGVEIRWISTAERIDPHAPEFDGQHVIYADQLTTDENENPQFVLRDIRDTHDAPAERFVSSGLTGIHHATNLLAAAAAAHAAGCELSQIAPVLNGLGPVSAHRMARTDRPDGITIIDDSYNANPQSVRAGLKTLALMGRSTRRRTWAILGEMLELGADRHAKEHILIGETVVRLNISQLLVVGEGARALYTGAVNEGSWGDEVDYVLTIDEAEQLLAERLEPGDIVFLKGSHSTRIWELADRLSAAGTDAQTTSQGEAQ